MMENPVRSPMVPPIADNMSTNFADLSLMILSVKCWGVKKDSHNSQLVFPFKI